MFSTIPVLLHRPVCGLQVVDQSYNDFNYRDLCKHELDYFSVTNEIQDFKY